MKTSNNPIWGIAAAFYFLLGSGLAIFSIEPPWLGGLCFALSVASLCIYFCGKKDREVIGSIATLSGIGLTFVGLIIALSNLELTNIDSMQSSLLSLLNGIYPAFFSSAAGVFVALTTHWAPNFWKYEANPDVEPDDVDHLILKELKSMNDKHSDLKNSFDDFAEKVVEMNTKALGKILEDTLGEIKRKLSDAMLEAIGDNIEKLRESIDNLNTWQKEYKQMIIENQEQLKQIQENTRTANELMERHVSALESSAATIEELKKGNIEMADDLKESLGQLEKIIRDNRLAYGNLLNFSEELEGLDRELIKAMKDSTDKAIEKLGDNLLSISNKLSEHHKRYAASVGEIMRITQEMIDNSQDN